MELRCFPDLGAEVLESEDLWLVYDQFNVFSPYIIYWPHDNETLLNLAQILDLESPLTFFGKNKSKPISLSPDLISCSCISEIPKIFEELRKIPDFTETAENQTLGISPLLQDSISKSGEHTACPK